MVSRLNFQDILISCKSNYRPFEKSVIMSRQPKNLIKSIQDKKNAGFSPIIAEIKPASPTMGVLKENIDIKRISSIFESSGACGISVLTEPKYFGGTIKSLETASKNRKIPVLRKDFIFDQAQIKESYFYGADSILLISSFFNEDGLASMIEESRKYGMEPLVEVHEKADIERSISAGSTLFAINNRDKDTLKIDLTRTEKLSRYIEGTTVSASGITSLKQLKYALQYCDAALIGSSLMTDIDTGKLLRSFVQGVEI
jgi:indole-3-glycerol phosphate synthase